MQKLLLSIATVGLWLLLSASAAAQPINWSKLDEPGHAEKYLAEFLRQVQDNPNDLQARISACEFTFYVWRLEKERSKRLALARRGFEIAKRTTELFPDSAAAWYWRSSTLAIMGLTQGVLDSLQLVPDGISSAQKSVDLDPTYRSGQAMANMGRMYTVIPAFPISAGNRVRGRELLLEGYKRNPNSTYFPLYLADAYWAEGDTENALRYAAEVREKKAANDYTQFVNRINMRKAQELERRIRAGEARDRFNDVLSD
jgi:tetratricopeptide (TPR) repeat protein